MTNIDKNTIRLEDYKVKITPMKSVKTELSGEKMQPVEPRGSICEM